MHPEWISFDCYGTLIDWTSGVSDAVRNVLDSYRLKLDLSEITRRYELVERQVEKERFRPYREVLQISFIRLFHEFGVDLRENERDLLVRGLPNWQRFQDVRPVLEQLRKHGFKLAVLSNVDRALIVHSLRTIGVSFDRIVTAEDVRCYKPATAHWEALLNQERITSLLLLHVSCSLYHDIEPANQLGIRNVWVNRDGISTVNTKPTFIVRSLSELPELVRSL